MAMLGVQLTLAAVSESKNFQQTGSYEGIAAAERTSVTAHREEITSNRVSLY
jgi:hypothetical protein